MIRKASPALPATENYSLSVVGLSIDFTASADVIATQLSNIWNNGYTPMIYLTSDKTSYAIAAGQNDVVIDQWIIGFKSWAGTDKFVFVDSALFEL